MIMNAKSIRPTPTTTSSQYGGRKWAETPPITAVGTAKVSAKPAILKSINPARQKADVELMKPTISVSSPTSTACTGSKRWPTRGKTMEKKGTNSTAPETPIVQTVIQMVSAIGNIHQN